MKINNTIKKNITILTFGYKHGLPQADLIINTKALPNQNSIKSLKDFDGSNKRVSKYVLGSKKGIHFVTNVNKKITALCDKSDKNDIIVGIGCIGGRHRSVAVACELMKIINQDKYNAVLIHRDLK